MSNRTCDDALYIMRQVTRFPLDIYCINYEQVEDFLRSPEIRLVSVDEDNIRGRKTFRALFVKLDAKDGQKVVGRN